MDHELLTSSCIYMYYTCLFLCRCSLSAGSPASCPSKSRVVEALCILLCDQYICTTSKGARLTRPEDIHIKV